MGASTENIPDKPYFKVSEVCRLTDTQPYVLRFWESEFPQLQPNKGSNGQALYSRADVGLVLRIKELLYEQEYTITGARQVLEGEPAGAAEPQAAASLAELPDDDDAAEEDSAPGRLDAYVDRHRYEDAVEEISALRLRVQELEAQLNHVHDGHIQEKTRLESELERRHRVGALLRGAIQRLEDDPDGP